MNKCYLYYSLICALTFWSGSIVFFWLYKSVEGGLWAAFAAMTAGVCFHLHKVYFENNLQSFYTLKTLSYLNTISFITCLIGTVFSLWYLFAIFYWKLPINDYSHPVIFPCVFSFLTGKWGAHLYVVTKEYMQEFLMTTYSPLIQNI